MRSLGPDPPGDPERGGGQVDPDVLALVRQAERELRRLRADLERPAGWEDQVRSLLALQAVAAALVDASRLHAEHLSRRAGRHGTDRPADG